MNTIELKNKVQAILPKWLVTVDEAQMLNLQADYLEYNDGVAYIEEFNTSDINTARYGVKLNTRHEITFCVFNELGDTAEQREQLRDQRIMPAVMAVCKMLDELGVTNISMDKYPRGFDANEVLVHITFSMSDNICLG